ncbi:MAG TPA: hypothetical protein VFC44_25845 [Candidatus Saccharimonadales bacterium]|nr:hypothetical protein [Candidatus Saccharimonadales bacterium]
MKTINGLPGIAESLLFALVVVVMVGCASTPENRATDEQPKITKEQRKIAEEERKAAKEQKHWQQALISYSDEQLRFKLAGLEQAVERGREGMNIILAGGNGIAILIAQGQLEAKVKERDAVGLEIARRDGTSHFGQSPRLDGNPSNNAAIRFIPPPPNSLRSSEPSKRLSDAGIVFVPDGYVVGGGHWIDDVMDDGNLIKLEDGSLWKVSPVDAIDSALWLPVTDITVIDSDDPAYPYKLVNKDDDEVVNARLIDQ